MAKVVSKLIQDAAGATGNGEEFDLQGAGIVNVQVVISNVASVTFEVSVDKANWTQLLMTDRSNAATTATNISASGTYFANVHGLLKFRARVSSWTSGTVDATASSYTVE